MAEFSEKLKAYREGRGISQNALARASGLNPASINRLESGERSPSNRALVEQICSALGLSVPERDDLLTSAGHLPDVYASVPPSDPTLLAVAGVLAGDGMSADELAEFRGVIETISRRWALHSGGSE